MSQYLTEPNQASRLLTPDECWHAMADHCPTLWDGDSPTVRVASDQWFVATLGCEHGKYHGSSAGWENDAIAVAFNRALDQFIAAHHATSGDEGTAP